MKKISKTVVFFGSGPVAAESLSLLTETFEIEAVVTKPRPEHHKGSVPVIELAAKLGLVTYTPGNKTELSELFATKPFKSEIGIVIDYGIIINKDVIDYFQLGIINSHFSLLPEWRGADPITFAILSGQKQTGVSLMRINEKMDEGPLLAQAPYDLDASITTPVLTTDLIELSYESLRQIIPLYLDGKISLASQDGETMAPSKKPTYSRKLTKEDGILDWAKPAEVLEREIRAFIEWPKSRARLGEIDAIITKAHVVQDNHKTPGKIYVASGSAELIVGCGAGALSIDALKPAGKPEMTVQAFLAGYRNKL